MKVPVRLRVRGSREEAGHNSGDERRGESSVSGMRHELSVSAMRDESERREDPSCEC